MKTKLSVKIGRIESIVTDVNEIVEGIAVAVEEQSISTNEIATNVSQVSKGIQEVTENIARSNTAVSGIAKDIAQVNQATQDLAGSAGNLKALVGKFKV